jgi:hypothetical protein
MTTKTKHKLGVIVPYRNRYEHLQEFKKSITEYLERVGINYELIIVEQDNAKLFNRGMLLNIGFTYAKRLKCDYVAFHDIDMLPLDVDYSYSDVPIHLATKFYFESGEKNREIFDTYFGGVTIFPVSTFKEINGYSNKYWGWGFEDDDLLYRCEEKVIPLDKKNYTFLGYNQYLKMNGINAYVKSKNIIDLNSSFTISINFCPSDNLKLNHTKKSDEFTIFSIPGYDFAISYTSYNRYNFCVFDNLLKAHFVNSEIKTNYLTNITITFDAIDKIIKFYQDGEFVDSTSEIHRFYSEYKKEEYFYLGVGKPERDIIPNWFNGYFKSFAYYDGLLSKEEIQQLGTNVHGLLSENFGNYKSKHLLKTYYDSAHVEFYKLKDLSNNDNDGEIINCEIVNTMYDAEKTILIPKRRNCKFLSLKHIENGFDSNGWKDENTRWNQLRFVNEVKNHPSLLDEGLSTLDFYEHGIEIENEHTRIITVAI